MARSLFLRGYDQQIANMIVSNMEKEGISFYRNSVPVKFEKIENSDRILVHFKESSSNDLIKKEEFDTVMLATGRRAATDSLNLKAAGVRVCENGKIETDNERTNIDNIYAIGDIVQGKPELTPVAIQAGKLLARRLYGGSNLMMDYINVPTCVFTPVEYGCCGYTEEEAINKFGEENIEVFHRHYTPINWGIEEKESNVCYLKLICNKLESMKVIGFHIFGDHAGEITQGVAIAIK